MTSPSVGGVSASKKAATRGSRDGLRGREPSLHQAHHGIIIDDSQPDVFRLSELIERVDLVAGVIGHHERRGQFDVAAGERDLEEPGGTGWRSRT